MQTTYVPNAQKADGQLGTGSNLRRVVSPGVKPTYVPSPNAADGAPVIAGAPDYIDYPGPPIDVPPKLAHIVVDSEGQQWQYFKGGWN